MSGTVVFPGGFRQFGFGNDLNGVSATGFAHCHNTPGERPLWDCWHSDSGWGGGFGAGYWIKLEVFDSYFGYFMEAHVIFVPADGSPPIGIPVWQEIG